MRIRLGVAMPAKGGRTAAVGAEVTEGRDSAGVLRHEFAVGHVARVPQFTVEAAAASVLGLQAALAKHRPCTFVDVGTPQGLALRSTLLLSTPPELHRPHAYPGVGMRPQLFSAFLQAYSAGRVHFEPGLPHRAELDRALVYYMGGKSDSGDVELASEDEALVVALGLALFWPKHGAPAGPIVARGETSRTY